MTSCSSVSLQKSPDQRSKSCDTVCSSNSGCFLQRRKPIHPLATGVRAAFSQPSSKRSNVRQRVLSAKLLKLRSLQSQINDANFHLSELSRENLALKNLQLRQEKALTKYEGTDADFPRLLKAHSEEVRILTEKNKILRKNVKELTDLIKNRDDELLSIKRQLEHLEKINKNRHLGERQKLAEQVDDLTQKLDIADNQINILNRKLMLEGKSLKQKLNTENNKHRLCQKNLMQALSEIERLTTLVDPKNGDKLLAHRKKSQEQETKSFGAMENKMYTSVMQKCDEVFQNETNSDILVEPKLRALNLGKLEDISPRCDLDEVIKSPTEKIKARLSSEPKRVTYDVDNLEKVLIDREKVSTNRVLTDREKLSTNRLSIDKEKMASDRGTHTSHKINSQKLDKLSNDVDSILQRSRDSGMEYDKTLGSYCSHVINTAKTCGKMVEDHQTSLDHAISDTDTLREAVDEIKSLDDQLKKNGIYSIDALELNKILKSDFDFKTSTNDRKDIGSKKSKRERNARNDHKEKLLATLRAIDNGETVESFDNERHCMDEIYEGVAD